MTTHVIVGAGQAGAYTAFAMREVGFSGRILLVGAEDELPYDRPPLSKSYLVAEDEPLPQLFFPRSAFDESGIELMLGRTVEEIDPAGCRLSLAGGARVGFDRLVMAMGSAPRRLSFPGVETVSQFRTIADARALRQRLTPDIRVLCIGAGVICLEVAAAARQRGCSVTVVEIGRSVMARSLPKWIGEQVERIHRGGGTEFLFGVSVVKIEGSAVTLDNGCVLQADIVVSGVGVERNIGIARRCGIETGTGIIVDEHGRTSHANIYASGEIAEYYCWRSQRHMIQESWKHAEQHGRCVGRAVAGIEERYDQVPWFWSDQGGLNVQAAGFVFGDADTVIRGDVASGSFSVFFMGDGDRIVGAISFNRGRDISAALRIIQQGRRIERAVLSDVAVTPQKMVQASEAIAS